MNKAEFNAKIKARMDRLEELLKSQVHINNPDKVEEAISSITKFYSSLEEEDREYLQYARTALEDKMPWNVPDD